MIAQAAVPSRYHALDALRAAMMFLGIYLHATVAYSPVGGWPYKPAQLTTTLDFSVGLIHVFRMPVFYVMAGFFAALLLQRYGFRRAADNRFWRIVVPFVVGWIILFPLVMFLAAVGRSGVDRALDFILSGKFLAYAHPLHLWFLEYLIVLYLLAVVAVMGVRFLLPQNVRGLLLQLLPLGRAVAVGAADLRGAVVPRHAADETSLARGSAVLRAGRPHRRRLRHSVRVRLAALPQHRPARDAQPARLALRGLRGGRELRLSRHLCDSHGARHGLLCRCAPCIPWRYGC